MKKVVPGMDEISAVGFLRRFLIYAAVVFFFAAVKWLLDGKNLAFLRFALQIMLNGRRVY